VNATETLVAGPIEDYNDPLMSLESSDAGKKYRVVYPTEINISGAVYEGGNRIGYTECVTLDVSGRDEVTFTILGAEMDMWIEERGAWFGIKLIYELNGVRQETTALFNSDDYPYGIQQHDYPIFEEAEICGKELYLCEANTEPCIELGEKDSDFKLVITNTRIMFMEGESVPAYINNQSLHITKAVIEEEIQQGEFVWKVRANGNMGLMWKGGT
jgi:hypothetical protein